MSHRQLGPAGLQELGSESLTQTALPSGLVLWKSSYVGLLFIACAANLRGGRSLYVL